MHIHRYRFVSIIYLYVYAECAYREVRGMFFFSIQSLDDKHNKGYKKYLEKKKLFSTTVAAGVRFIIKTKGNNDNDDCIERTRVPSTTDHNNIGIFYMHTYYIIYINVICYVL